MSSKVNFKYLDTITAFFVVSLLASNLLSSAKLVDSKMSIFGVNLILDGGLIVFPFCYIFADILTEVYGFKRSRKVIWLGFGGMLIFTALISFVRILPAETSWAEAGGVVGYDFILYGLFSGVLILSSLSGYLVGEFANSIVLAKLKVMLDGRFVGIRFIGSTVIGQLLDTLVFFTVATIGGVFDSELFLSLVLTNYIFKILVEVVFLPVSIKVSSYLKNSEQQDIFDRDTSFNPFG